MLNKIALLIVFLFSNLLTLSWAGVNICRLPDNSLLSPPTTEEPVTVKVSNFVLDIEKVDDQKQQFNSDFIIDYIWHDARLGEVAKRAQGPCQFNLNDVWNPAIQIFNIRKVTTRLANLVKVEQNGTVTYTQRYYGALASPLDLSEFPFDQQILTFSFISLLDSTQVILENNPVLSGQDPTFSNAGWNNIGVENQLSSYQPQSGNTNSYQLAHTQLDFNYIINRDVQYYRWKVLLPLSLIVIMSWAVFWIEPGQLGPRLSVSTTSLLTVIAFLFGLRGILPPVSYLTRMDYFIYGSIFLIFLTHLIALLTSSYAAREKITEARLVIKYARFIVPLSFLLNTVYFLYT